MGFHECAEYSRGVFINNIATYLRVHRSSMKVSISNLFSGPYILLPWNSIFMQNKTVMCFMYMGAAGSVPDH